MNKLDKILVIIFVVLMAFIVVTEIQFFMFQNIPDTLVTCILGTGVLELAFTTVIQVAKIRARKGKDDRDNKQGND